MFSKIESGTMFKILGLEAILFFFFLHDILTQDNVSGMVDIKLA